MGKQLWFSTDHVDCRIYIIFLGFLVWYSFFYDFNRWRIIILFCSCFYYHSFCSQYGKYFHFFSTFLFSCGFQLTLIKTIRNWKTKLCDDDLRAWFRTWEFPFIGLAIICGGCLSWVHQKQTQKKNKFNKVLICRLIRNFEWFLFVLLSFLQMCNL